MQPDPFRELSTQHSVMLACVQKQYVVAVNYTNTFFTETKPEKADTSFHELSLQEKPLGGFISRNLLAAKGH